CLSAGQAWFRSHQARKKPRFDEMAGKDAVPVQCTWLRLKSLVAPLPVIGFVNFLCARLPYKARRQYWSMVEKNKIPDFGLMN
ncbi:MAG: hypothetical protein UMU75_01835, partial [Halomonas sp.]|nr:hypothetical protein [Halomonas sp.]